jgi:RNA polymerase sigma-70 factor (ECF subfamily)
MTDGALHADDPADFRAIYKETMPTLQRLAANIVKDLDAAEDICHTAFARLYEQEKVFATMSNATYYLVRVVMNEARSFLRHRNVLRFIPLAEELDTPVAVKSTEDAFFEQLDATKVQEALYHLPQRYREAIFLREYAGFQYGDISEVMGIKTTNVKVVMHRARSALLNRVKRMNKQKEEA